MYQIMFRLVILFRCCNLILNLVVTISSSNANERDNARVQPRLRRVTLV